MEEPSTSRLMDVLKSAGSTDLSEYEHTYLTKGCRSFPAYMDALISGKHLKRQDIFQKADVPQKYGYKLLTGESHTTDRDKLLRIFFAMEMDLKEVQRALALYPMPVLYPKNRRDAVMIIAINRRVHSVDEVNELLAAQGEEPLRRSPD